MKKLTAPLFAVLVICGFLYLKYQEYRGGSHLDLQPNQWTLTFGPTDTFFERHFAQPEFRVIMVDIEEDYSRNYFARYNKPPIYFETAWATCRSATEAEVSALPSSWRNLRGTRLEALCAFETDGEVIPMGVIISAPRLEGSAPTP